MGKKSADAPDYVGAALMQGQLSRENTEAQTWANRPDQQTPWGQVGWSNTPQWDPTTNQWVNRWSQDMTLNPMLQWALENQQYLQGARSELGGDLMDRAAEEFGTPMDWSALPEWGASPGSGDEARAAAEQALMQRQQRTLDPQWEQAQSDMESRLWSQGLRPGDAAYDREMENFQRGKTDAYEQARLASITGGGQEAARQQQMDLTASNYQNTMRQAQLAEMLQQRGFSLNEINALISGQQVAQPSMPDFKGATKAETPDILGATDMGYQADLADASARNMFGQNLLGGLGMAYGMYSGGMFG